jgi:hypothetical protein
MSSQYTYTCPNCAQDCAVDDSLLGQDVLCPHCSQRFFATPPEPVGVPPQSPEEQNKVVLPEKIPFLKSGKRKILKERLDQLISERNLSDEDEKTLYRTALALGLEKSEVDEIRKEEFFKEFEPIQHRISKSWLLTDEDLQEIEILKRKYNISTLNLGGDADYCRRIYLIETKHELPPPIRPDVMLNAKEFAYFSVGSIWRQTRVHRDGYTGTSVSIPTGIKGVRFRFGQYTPSRHEELTPLSDGTLWVTSKRLIFHGTSRNTKIDYKKLIDAHIFIDALRIDKETGKSDFFSMTAVQARYITALIGALKE